MSGYAALGEYYDRLMGSDISYADRADRLLALFARYHTPPHTLLDLACGSGRLTRELAQRGMDMVAVDNSPAMLTRARQAVEGITPPVLLLCQDMRALDLNDTVDGAVCMQDSFSHLCRTADVRAALARLYLFIAPGGLLIFDVNTPYKHREVLGNRDFVLEQEGLLCLWRNHWHARTGEVTMELDFLEEQPDGRYERTSDEVRERAYSLATWRRLLTDSGFTLLTVLDEDGTGVPAKTAERWWLVAKNTRPAEEYRKGEP